VDSEKPGPSLLIAASLAPAIRPARWSATLTLAEDPSSSELQSFQLRKAQLREDIHGLDEQIDQLKLARKNTPHPIPAGFLPEEDRFTRLRTVSVAIECPHPVQRYAPTPGVLNS